VKSSEEAIISYFAMQVIYNYWDCGKSVIKMKIDGVSP